MDARFDAIVVGAGPAGAATAIQMAESGRRVLLLDACAFPRSKVCGEFLSPAIWPLLEALQVADVVRPLAIPLERLQLVLPRACTTEIQLQHGAAMPPVAISRYAFDQVLVERALATGVEARFGLRVCNVLMEKNRAVGVVTSPVDHGSAFRCWTAPLVIAADGRRSAVVKATGQVERGQALQRVGFKTHLRVAGGAAAPFDGRLAMHSLPGGYVGVCPVEDGTINVCGVMPAHLLRAARGAISAALKRWGTNDPLLQDLLRAGRPEYAWLTMPEVARQVARPRVEGVLYVGDAQGTTEPVAGQGITLALEGARLLSALVERAGQATADARTQLLIQQHWQGQVVTRRRRAAWLGWLLEHPVVGTAAWRIAASMPGSRRDVLRRAYSASMASPARAGADCEIAA